jgi:hypothetical protein
MAEFGQERRAAKRIFYLCDVECEGGAPDPIRPRMRDLSVTGAFIEASTLVPLGTRLLLRFSVPAGEIAVTAEVVHHRDPGMGVRFLEMDESQRAAIEEAVRLRSAEPVP